ncbi:actin-related protein T2 [Pelobates fuscus]|uniref:actin-related protein T2 n=1 Tax=Pelobates fuscus TaxID=191477 RepID=UPI002FE4C738
MFDSKVLDLPAVIFDNGSGLCKAGFSGDSYPRSVISSVVGRPREFFTTHGAGRKNYYVGKEAQSMRGVLTLKYPIEHGVINNWEDMEKIWKHMYNCELKINPSDRPVLLTEAPLNPLKNRETMAEMMFEGFNVPALYIALQASLSLYASGCITGLVIDCGDGVTHTSPIYQGYHLVHSGSRLDIAGMDITKHLMTLLTESGISFISTSEREIVRDIKEQHCYVATDFNKEMKKSTSEIVTDYELPDGKLIKLGNQRFRAPEILFTPSRIGMDTPGMHEMVINSILQSDIDVRRDLLNNVILSGGSTLFPGIDKRLKKEMEEAFGVPVNVIANPQRKYHVWIGASVITSLASFKEKWVTVADYNEHGASVVHSKCIK